MKSVNENNSGSNSNNNHHWLGFSLSPHMKMEATASPVSANNPTSFYLSTPPHLNPSQICYGVGQTERPLLPRQFSDSLSYTFDKQMGKKGRAIEYELPEDVLIDVLSRVPAKSLLRFKSVSKHCTSRYDFSTCVRLIDAFNTVEGLFERRSMPAGLSFEGQIDLCLLNDYPALIQQNYDNQRGETRFEHDNICNLQALGVPNDFCFRTHSKCRYSQVGLTESVVTILFTGQFYYVVWLDCVQPCILGDRCWDKPRAPPERR
ncbi:hypothetical protein RHMOL_RhmolUnG0003100 [Rhododendron molle]|nr:hypothetical protein RHMOL_RhmolUnG0003100 [Rhododendron molle]